MMLTIFFILLIFTQALVWQTREFATLYRFVVFAMCALTARTVWTNKKRAEELTFAFLPALMLAVMSMSDAFAPHVPAARWGATGAVAFGLKLFYLAEDPAGARYLSVLFFACCYIILAMRSNVDNIARALARAGVFIYALTIAMTLSQIARHVAIAPEALILQQRSYASTLCVLLLPVAQAIQLKRLRDGYVALGVVATLCYRSDAGYLLLALYFASHIIRNKLALFSAISALTAFVIRFATFRTFTDRMMFWRGALAQFRSAPILGVGPGRFFAAGLTWPGWFAHNAPLTWIAETGAAGGGVLSLAAAMVYGTRRRRAAWANDILMLFAASSCFDDAWLMMSISLIIASALSVTQDPITQSLEETFHTTRAAQVVALNSVKNGVKRLWKEYTA